MSSQLFSSGFELVSGFLNAENNAASGGFAGLAGAPGELGAIAAYTNALAAQKSKASVGTCFGGLYQKVVVLSTQTATPARGQIAYWSDLDDYIVTTDGSLAVEGRVAGILLSAPTKGNQTIIQVGGLASVLFRATITNKTDGNIVTALTTTNTADAIADATGSYIGGGALGLKNIIGTCYGIPVDNSISPVLLRNIPLNL